MDNEDGWLIIGVIAACALFVVFGFAGVITGKKEISEACDRKGEFVASGYVYSCELEGRE